MSFIEIKNLYKTYTEGNIKTEVLKGINLKIEQNQLISIIGQSGSGKSTLLHLLGTLDSANAGEILFEKRNLCTLSSKEQSIFRNQNLGFVYQFHHLLSDFSALENVMMPLLIAKVPKQQAKELALEYLQKVNLAGKEQFKPKELSGGQRQRVAIARALVNKPKLILADEPTGNLDEENANLVFSIFKDLVKNEHTTLVLVTHDQQLAKQTDCVYCIKNGVIES